MGIDNSILIKRDKLERETFVLSTKGEMVTPAFDPSQKAWYAFRDSTGDHQLSTQSSFEVDGHP
jgi:hypothetical protein